MVREFLLEFYSVMVRVAPRSNGIGADSRRRVPLLTNAPLPLALGSKGAMGIFGDGSAGPTCAVA